MTDNEAGLEDVSKSSLRIKLVLFVPSVSDVFTFFGSKLFLLFRFVAEEGDEPVSARMVFLFGDITEKGLLLFRVGAMERTLGNVLQAPPVVVLADVVNFSNSAFGEAVFNNTGLVGVVNLNNA